MDLLLFFVCILSFIFFSYTMISSVCEKNNFYKRYEKKINIIDYILIVVLIALFITVKTGAVQMGGYIYLPLWCTLYGVLASVITFLREKNIFKTTAILSFITKLAAVSLFLEFFVFNLNSAHLFMKDYKETELSDKKAGIENYDTSAQKNSAAGDFSLEFKNFNMQVGTITFDVYSDKREIVEVSIDMSDDTNSSYYRDNIANTTIISGNTRSMTIPCNFSGNVHDLKFRFHANKNENIYINKITLNKPILFHFSFVRIAVIFLISVFMWLMISSYSFKKSYIDNEILTSQFAIMITMAFLMVSLFLLNYGISISNIFEEFRSMDGNQLTKGLVDAFESGRTYLQNADPSLTELQNPYDLSQRDVANVSYPWDHLLYDGKIYSYYGIAPVLLVFLPYHILTGYYFPTVWATWIFGALGIFFLTKFYLCFMKKFFSKTRSSLVLTGLILIQLSSGIWTCFYGANFYEIAQTSGFLSVVSGAFFLISSNVIGDGIIKRWRLALSTVLLSLGVLCRPTLAIYCIAALLFIYAGLRKLKGTGKKNYISYLLCAMLPFVLIGSVQMIYNYMRFGSFYDFGIQYSLTINDFTRSEYHTHFVAVGFFNYLFAWPGLTYSFPFLDMNTVETFYPQGFYFIATHSAVGLLWKCLPIISYGYSKRAYRICENKNKKLYTIILSAVCIVAPFIIMFSIWESGYAARYSVDFAWQIILGALVIAFIVYDKCRENMKNHLNKIMTISGLISFILMVAQVYYCIDPEYSSSNYFADDVLSLARLFEFWR